MLEPDTVEKGASKQAFNHLFFQEQDKGLHMILNFDSFNELSLRLARAGIQRFT